VPLNVLKGLTLPRAVSRGFMGESHVAWTLAYGGEAAVPEGVLDARGGDRESTPGSPPTT
jgi:hypothetical protein